MGDRLKAVRLVVAIALIILLAVGETVVGQTPTPETIVFVDASKEAPSCCPVPSMSVEVVGQAAVKQLPGIIRLSVDEAKGRLTIIFDPARVSRAKIVATLAWYNFQPLEERR